MKLYYAPQSPFARKVRIAAIELGLEEQIELAYVEVVPGKPNVEFGSAHNPLRKIPALLTSDGLAIYDSTVICEYLDDLAGGAKLLPSQRPRRWRVLTNHALAQGMCEAAILVRYETWLRPDQLRWTKWTDDHWDKINSGLAWFDQNADELNDPIDLAQITLGCLLGYVDFRWPDNGWRGRFTAVADWYEELGKRPSFARTMPQAPPEA